MQAMTGTVEVLLSTFNAGGFLSQQLESVWAQDYPDVSVVVRDDGSADGTVEQIEGHLSGRTNARFIVGEHLGAGRSFLALLSAIGPEARYAAFCDQDDVWLPEKLARGIAALRSVPASRPALYCARRILVDSQLRRTGEPGPLRHKPGFPSALTQNVAPGCTMILNRAAADLILATEPPDTVWHDWWCYVAVAAAGGAIIVDPAATVLYRQHGANCTGEAQGVWRRGIAALRRGPGAFMRLLRQHVATREARPHLISSDARRQLEIIARGLRGGPTDRVRALRLPGFRRQTWLETLVFWVWFMIG